MLWCPWQGSATLDYSLWLGFATALGAAWVAAVFGVHHFGEQHIEGIAEAFVLG